MDLYLSTAFFLNAFENPYAFGALIAFGGIALSLLRRNYGLSFFLTIGLTFGATHIIKSIYKVARPLDALTVAQGYRFPSMHASIAAALLTSLAWHAYFATSSHTARFTIISITALFIAFVGSTRLLLGVHEVIDVVVGATLGASISLALHYAMRRYQLE